MSIRVYIHALSPRAESSALLDLGVTKNFISEQYTVALHLPMKMLPTPRKVYNVDGSLNQKGDIRFYTNLEVQTGEKQTNMRFFMTELGPHQLILGTPGTQLSNLE